MPGKLPPLFFYRKVVLFAVLPKALHELLQTFLALEIRFEAFLACDIRLVIELALQACLFRCLWSLR